MMSIAPMESARFYSKGCWGRLTLCLGKSDQVKMAWISAHCETYPDGADTLTKTKQMIATTRKNHGQLRPPARSLSRSASRRHSEGVCYAHIPRTPPKPLAALRRDSFFFSCALSGNSPTVSRLKSSQQRLPDTGTTHYAAGMTNAPATPPRLLNTKKAYLLERTKDAPRVRAPRVDKPPRNSRSGRNMSASRPAKRRNAARQRLCDGGH